jgi:hypothetical protein
MTVPGAFYRHSPMRMRLETTYRTMPISFMRTSLRERFTGRTPSSGAWLARTGDSGWVGWDSRGENVALDDEDWTPWSSVLDQSAAPYYRWFTGGQTNACFNLVDRHLLQGRAEKTAIIFEGDRWDPSKNEGRGGPGYRAALQLPRPLRRSCGSNASSERLGTFERRSYRF